MKRVRRLLSGALVAFAVLATFCTVACIYVASRLDGMRKEDAERDALEMFKAMAR